MLWHFLPHMFLGLILAAVLAIAPVSQSKPFASSGEIKQLLESRGVRVGSVASIRGTAFLIHYEGDAPEGPFHLPRSAKAINLTPEQVKKFVGLLHGPRTYMPDFVKLCAPSREVGVALVSTKGYTEIHLCLMCDEMWVLDGANIYAINTDQGHNAFLDFFREAFPGNEALKAVHRSEKEEVLTAETAIEWAEDCIPNDPLLKKVKAMKPEEQTFEVLEALANKATYAMRNRGRETPKKRVKKAR
jgi:hypothetical protein